MGRILGGAASRGGVQERRDKDTRGRRHDGVYRDVQTKRQGSSHSSILRNERKRGGDIV